jgi:hypothetical protein
MGVLHRQLRKNMGPPEGMGNNIKAKAPTTSTEHSKPVLVG